MRDALQAEVDALRAHFEAWRAALAAVNTAADTAFQRQHQGAPPPPKSWNGFARSRPRAAAAARAHRPSAPPRPRAAELHRELVKTAEMCRKVKAALANIEARRDKFAHIDDRELDRRKEAVGVLEKVRACARARGGGASAAAALAARARLSMRCNSSPKFAPVAPSAPDNRPHERRFYEPGNARED